MNPSGGLTIQIMTSILTNKVFLIVFAIGLIIFALFGLPILVTMPHILIAAAFIIIGITIMASPTILTAYPLYKIILGLGFFAVAGLVYFEPTWFGVTVPNMIGGAL